MLLTSHTVVGLAVGFSVRNPQTAVPLSLAMHFLGDLVPHWDPFTGVPMEDRIDGWRPIAVMVDLVIGVAIGLTATLYTLWVIRDSALALTIFLCGIASVLPDVIEGPLIYTKREPKISKLVFSVQMFFHNRAPFLWGIITQILVVFVSYVVISNSIGL